MSYKNIVLAGATGNLGPSILDALVASQSYNITVLSRSPSVPSLPSSVNIVQVDYTSQTSLTTALHGQDVLICALPNHKDQPTLVDAAISAGVKLFIPSEFGSDVPGNENCRALPVFEGKVLLEKYLQERKDKIDYTFIINGLFLEWAFQLGVLVNTKGTTKIYDGGERKVSMTRLDDIGKAVVGVLKNPEKTRNRAVYVQSACVSQNQILEMVKGMDKGFKAEVEQVKTEDVRQDAYKELEKKEPDMRKAMFGFILVSIMGEGYGGDWSGKLDNELLGVDEMDEEKIKEFAKKYL